MGRIPGSGADSGLAPVDVTVEGLEVVQAVQEPGNSVALVAGKSTVLRAYLGTSSPSAVTVRGVLKVAVDSSSIPFLIPSLNEVLVDPGEDGATQAKRDDSQKSLNFLLPGEATVAGSVNLALESIESVDDSSDTSLSGSSYLSVSFLPGLPLRLRVLGIRYTDPAAPGSEFVPSQRDVDLVFSWLRRAYPIADLQATYAVVDANHTWPFTATQVNAQLAAIREQDIQTGTDQRTHYYGLVSDGPGGLRFMRGRASGIPGSPNPAVVASGPTGTRSFGWDHDGVYGDWYTAHELGHTFGRRHPGFCRQSVDDAAYPHAGGQLADPASKAYVGFDVGDGAALVPMAALPGADWHDVMSYCDNQWLSHYTYEGIRQRLAAEDALGGGQDEGVEDMGMGGIRRSQIVATINLAKGTGRIEYVQPVADAASSAENATGDAEATVRIHGAGDTVLAEHPAAVRFESCMEDEDSSGFIDVTVPIPDETEAVSIVYEGSVIATYSRRGRPSALSGMRALRSPEAHVSGLEWSSAEAEDPQVTYTVQVSRDQGERWETLAAGRPNPFVRFQSRDFPGVASLRVRVIATDGFESTAVSEEDIELD